MTPLKLKTHIDSGKQMNKDKYEHNRMRGNRAGKRSETRLPMSGAAPGICRATISASLCNCSVLVPPFSITSPIDRTATILMWWHKGRTSDIIGASQAIGFQYGGHGQKSLQWQGLAPRRHKGCIATRRRCDLQVLIGTCRDFRLSLQAAGPLIITVVSGCYALKLVAR